MAHVLIVDDSESERRVLTFLLENNGYRVTGAGSGEDGLEAARRDKPDVVISDVVMKDMDGFVFCHTWMKDAELRSVPFMFYTGYLTSRQDERVGFGLGAARYLLKPLEASALLFEIAAVLKERTGRPSPKS